LSKSRGRFYHRQQWKYKYYIVIGVERRCKKGNMYNILCLLSAYKVVGEIECKVLIYRVQPNNTHFLTLRGNEYQGCSVHDMPVNVVFIVIQRKNASKDNKKLTTFFSHKRPSVQIQLFRYCYTRIL
jgi:hypothetical protein